MAKTPTQKETKKMKVPSLFVTKLNESFKKGDNQYFITTAWSPETGEFSIFDSKPVTNLTAGNNKDVEVSIRKNNKRQGNFDLVII
jgi:predicted P-loop ATPase